MIPAQQRKLRIRKPYCGSSKTSNRDVPLRGFDYFPPFSARDISAVPVFILGFPGILTLREPNARFFLFSQIVRKQNKWEAIILGTRKEMREREKKKTLVRVADDVRYPRVRDSHLSLSTLCRNSRDLNLIILFFV